MASVSPDGWRALEATGAAVRERETLALLEAGLPDSYTVYHAVHWTRLEHGFSVYGEIDFVLVNRAGDVLLIEQKSGFLLETPEGLVKRYASRDKSVPMQMARSAAAFRAKLQARPGCQTARVDYLLYCPDYQVRQVETAGLAPERIVDARRRERLAECVRAALPEGEEAAMARETHRFLRGVLQLQTDVSALVGRARALVNRISGGLAQWAGRLEFTPFRLAVAGVAGCGKTQLALAQFQAALERGERPLYLCFNRPLADHFQRIAPPGGWIGTFHMLCDQRLREAGRIIDFSRPDAFAVLESAAAELPAGGNWRFDTLILDEGQDFTPAWRDQALALARGPESRVFWLEDPMQNLYERPPARPPRWPLLRAPANHRSPRAVVRFLQALLPEPETLEAAGPLGEGGLEVLTYRDAAELKEKVKEGLRLCVAAGYKRDDLALITWRGRDQSLLFPYTQLGPHTLRTFSGRYDLLGQPIHGEGEVLLETVYRFKGQSAPAVVFAEIDFETLDEKALRKLYVGATRAMMLLVLVMSERAAARLLDALPD